MTTGWRERLRSHPFAVEAWFDWSLALVFPWPREILEPFLGPGLELDLHGDHGFVAVALVQTRALRPAGFPRMLGRNFLLIGYRIFARYTTPEGRTLRGLRILRSDTDRRSMSWLGNLFTHYGYHHAGIRVTEDATSRRIEVRSDDGKADLRLRTHHAETSELPAGSVFSEWSEARRWAGPMPFTFDASERGVLRVEGRRSDWKPRPVSVEIEQLGFFAQPPFRDAGPPRLANAFLVENVPYRWEPGIFAPHPSARAVALT